MEIEVNGDVETFDADALTVASLLDRLGIERIEGLAVAVDAEVVTRSRWEEREVVDGAEVEIIRATQGG